MKKYKIIIISMLIILSIYCVFVIVDCVRLRKATIYTKPFITVSRNIMGNKATYYGLGYCVSYYIDRDINLNENGGAAISGSGMYGAEFRLFNKMLVWAWVE